MINGRIEFMQICLAPLRRQKLIVIGAGHGRAKIVAVAAQLVGGVDAARITSARPLANS